MIEFLILLKCLNFFMVARVSNVSNILASQCQPVLTIVALGSESWQYNHSNKIGRNRLPPQSLSRDQLQVAASLPLDSLPLGVVVCLHRMTVAAFPLEEFASR
jgi:hypothetical protein